MRDIRPTNKPKPPMGVPPESLPSPKKLYAKPDKIPQRPSRFTGASVPVASTPVPPIEETMHPKTPMAAKKPKRAAAKLGDKERKLIALLALLVVAVLGLAAFLFLPKATVVLTLQTAPLLLDQELSLKNVPAPEPGVIPASSYSREVAVEGAAAVSTRKVVGVKATGTAQIINRTVDEQKIKELSRLVTADGTLFYMQKHAIVPPNSSVPVLIEAADAGPQGNVEPQELNFAALDESAQSLVFAELTTATSGGSGEEIAVVTGQDIERTQQEAIVAARDQVEQEIRAGLPNGWLLLEESWAGELASFETTAKDGDESESVPYSATATVMVFAYEEEALQKVLQAGLEGRLDENHMLFPEPISFTKSVRDIDWDNQQATLDVRVTHTTIPKFSLDSLQEKLAGQNKDKAITYLEGLPGIKAVTVDIWPAWAGSIPRIEKRIEVELVPDRQP